MAIKEIVLGSQPSEVRQDREAALSSIRSVCERRLRRRFVDGACENGTGAPPPPAIQSRLDQELAAFATIGQEHALFRLAELAQLAKDKGIIIAVRGAAAGSLVLHAVGLSPICPCDHDLFFERFIGEGQPGSDDTVHIDCLIEPQALGIIDGLKTRGNDSRPNLHVSLIPEPDLGVIGHITRLIQSKGGSARLHQIPTDDAATFQNLHEGKLTPVLHLRQLWVREFIHKVRPGNFDDLVTCIWLCHPDRIKAGWPDQFFNRSRASEEIPRVHPVTDKLLSGTKGIPLYQEELMQIVNQVSGLGLREGYFLIRDIAAKRSDHITGGRERFIRGAEERGTDATNAEKVFEIILHAAPVSTCKANAYVTGFLTYWAAWLQTHFAEEFREAQDPRTAL